MNEYDETGLEIAVIGMNGRFPEADTLAQFWNNLVNGKDSFIHFDDEELKESGIGEEDYKQKGYVKVKPFLDHVFDFDAELFGYTAWEATYMDPQIKLFHECVYHALEDAGYDPERYEGRIGLYAGASMDLQWTKCLLMSQKKLNNNILETSVVSSKDFISQLISYKLNLTGPSISFYTACSTSLASIHMACSSLLLGECNMAVAGGVTLMLPSKAGYEYSEGSIYSKDGCLRAYDEQASGTVFGEGAGAVVLKRLSDAMEDNDHIYAVIRATACNNDGSRKVGFTAPSVEGQKEVIKTAFEMGEVEPSSIQMLEGHGTGTNVGDPIEVEALKQAFDTDERQYCALGSVKANIGHLYAGAGVASFIKAALALEHEMIPPACQFDVPNKKMKISETPFYINKEPVKMVRRNAPLRAGVSSFGVGGTNIHIILQEAPKVESVLRKQEKILLQLSARTKQALEEMTDHFVEYFNNNENLNMADVAFTLNTGRKQYQYNRCLVVRDAREAADLLADREARERFTYVRKANQQPIVFACSNRDKIAYGIANELYKEESAFQMILDEIAEEIQNITGFDVRQVLCADVEQKNGQETEDTKAVFAYEYAMAKFYEQIGVIPEMVSGSGTGEYIAAVYLGVMSIEEAVDAMESKISGRRLPETIWNKAEGTFLYDGEEKVEEQSYLLLKLDIESSLFLNSLIPVMQTGTGVDWNAYYKEKNCYKVSLPLYPFQRKSFKPDFLKYMNTSMHDGVEPVNSSKSVKKEFVFERPKTDEDTYVAPVLEADKIICEVVSEVLSMKQVGMHDDFFWLGAHSLLITKIITRLKEIFRTDIPLDEVMEHPTIESIHKILIDIWKDEDTLNEIALAFREYQKIVQE